MPAPERLQAFYTMSRLSYESGNRKDTVDYATGALRLSVREKEGKLTRIQQTELMAMMLSVLPIEQVDKDKVIDLIDDLGDASIENQKAMELLLDLLQKLFTGDNESVHQVCDIRVMMYESIGLRDEMRCRMARAYYQRACVLMDLGKKEESFADFYTAYEIYDSVRNKDDVFVSDLAYTSYALTTLSLDLKISIDCWQVLKAGADSMSLLLYYRRGWGELSWLMDEILTYMEMATSLPDWSSHRKKYEDYKEEYENYRKRS
jgi:tetratricopeptide (TPR) repeat protein